MRKVQKQQIEESFALLRNAHEAIRKWLEKGNRTNAMQLLSNCQESAIQAGNLIEQTEGEDVPAIRTIEDYCETCWQIYERTRQEEEQKPSGVYRLLQKKLAEMDSSVRLTIPVRLEIAFFCYKTDMSDCLESIYHAAKADSSCDAYFIPVPYYDRYPDGTFGEMYDEGEEGYTGAYDLVDWRSYDVEVRRPDIIYIMNPYDDENNMISIHPDYYAARLRGLTDCLVYVPYHLQRAVPSPGTGSLPGVLFSDLTFVQSVNVRERYIESFLQENEIEGMTVRTAKEKIVALGSPKTDKLVRTGREDYTLPEAWREAVSSDDPHHGTVLYNLSISSALNMVEDGGKLYLGKIRSALEFFKDRSDVTLWLRPHSLLHQTLRFMDGELADEYEEIIREYKEAGWGIYDDTPDLNRAVAWCDACYGDENSVALMFEFLGKPSLIQNIENAGSEPREAGDEEAVRAAVDALVNTGEENSYIMYEAGEQTEDGRLSTADFLGHMDVILEYAPAQMEKCRKLYANADGTAGEKIHAYTTSLLRRARREEL